MREYDIFVPLHYNDGASIEGEQFQALQAWILARFDGITVFPQANKGKWRMADVIFEDDVVIYRVLADRSTKTYRFFKALKRKLELALEQEKILIVFRNVGTVQ